MEQLCVDWTGIVQAAAAVLTVMITALMVVVTAIYAWLTRSIARKTSEAAEHARKSAEAAEKSARYGTFEMLMKLHLDETDPEQGRAKRLIAEAAQCQPGDNPYAHARQHIENLKNNAEAYKDFDDARRRLAHFWLRAVKLVDWGVVSENELFNNFQPNILRKLEPFETIVVEQIAEAEGRSSLSEAPQPWPAMRLYINWLQDSPEGKKLQETEGWRPTLPARLPLYEKSLQGNETK